MFRSKSARTRFGAIGILALVLGTASCQGPPPPNPREEAWVLNNPVIVGTVTDEPGFSYQDPLSGLRSGFDVDMVEYLSNDPSSPKFSVIYNDGLIADRADLLRKGPAQGGASIVAASYTITTERELAIDFSEPYLQTQQGVMVRADYPESVQNPKQLVGKTVCAQRGSTSFSELAKIPGIIVRQEDGLGECVAALQAGNIDAVSTDEVLLFGYASSVNKKKGIPPSQRLRVEDNANFGPIAQYAIGLPPQDGIANCNLVSGRLKNFIVSKAWESSLKANFGSEVDVDQFRPRQRACVADHEN